MTKKTLNLPNTSARNIAVNALLGFERNDLDIQDSLDAIFKTHQTPPKEKGLATELALGVCRQLITLDHILGIYSERPLKRIEAGIVPILRIGLYQMMFLSGTPDFAAVDEAVKQAHAAGGKGVSGFVNAILRAVQRDSVGLVDSPSDQRFARATIWIDAEHGYRLQQEIFPRPAQNLGKFFSLSMAHPKWLIERWITRYNKRTVWRICLANNQRPPMTLRPNRLKSSPADLMSKLKAAGIAARSCGEEGVQLEETINPQQLPGFAEGHFSVQDPAAMSVAPHLEVQPGMRVLDLCAAPGGKTTHLAELMGNQGTIVACDVNREKLARIQENCDRLGLTCVRTCLVNDLAGMIEKEGQFDAVLADVPCSNTGVMARRVEVRHRLKHVGIQRVVKLQEEILEQADAALKPGGRLLYSTCSIEPVENELQVQAFLELHPNYSQQRQRTILPAFTGLTGENDPLSPNGHDGGFTAILEKRI